MIHNGKKKARIRKKKLRLRCRGCGCRIWRRKNVTGLKQHRCSSCADAEYAARLLACLHQRPKSQITRIDGHKCKITVRTADGEEIDLTSATVNFDVVETSDLVGMVEIKGFEAK